MGKILALDIGEKRVGYAVSDEGELMAFPRAAIPVQSRAKFLERLRIILKEENIKKIVIGLPLDSDNNETPAAEKIRALGETIARNFMLPIEYVDEFGTTDEALLKIPFRKDRIKKAGYTDAVAAQIILQRCLDGKKKVG